MAYKVFIAKLHEYSGKIMVAKYFNPYTDFGFKKLFGEEGSKDLLIDFLNQLLPIHHQIQQLTLDLSGNKSSV